MASGTTFNGGKQIYGYERTQAMMLALLAKEVRRNGKEFGNGDGRVNGEAYGKLLRNKY